MMRFSLRRAGVVARREYRATVRRRAFIFTTLLMPLLFGGILTLSIRQQGGERRSTLEKLRTLAVVDSSGLYAGAPDVIETQVPQRTFDEDGPQDTFRTTIRRYASTSTALSDLRSGAVDQVLVVPANYLAEGRARRYVMGSRMFSGSDEGPVRRWLATGLLHGQADSLRIERATLPGRHMVLLNADPAGGWKVEDDRSEVLGFALPYLFAILLGMGIFTGGQYLMQGVSEEKETRILESLLCTVTPEDLLLGKLIGLGGAGLTMVAVWMSAGVLITGQMAAMMPVHIPPAMLGLAFVYFVLGLLFYGTLMLTVGAVTSNMRESQQYSVVFSMLNMSPLFFLAKLLSHPDARQSVIMSLFPPTAPVSMMLRMNAPAYAVPPWQIAVSLGLLALSAAIVVMAAARIFRIALLLYGKTPNLPEILRWARSAG
jgi:ABC-2 type transport system permease protein